MDKVIYPTINLNEVKRLAMSNIKDNSMDANKSISSYGIHPEAGEVKSNKPIKRVQLANQFAINHRS